MRWCGVDPGLSGAIATIDEDRSYWVTPTPVVVAEKGKGRTQYDLPAIRNILAGLKDEELFVTIEKGQTLPPKMGGGIANFQRGLGLGLFQGILVGLGIPYQLVSPQAWQRTMHEGCPGEDTKQRSILAAHRLFPAADLRRTERSKKDHDGKAEALLIAHWGMTLGVQRRAA